MRPRCGTRDAKVGFSPLLGTLSFTDGRGRAQTGPPDCGPPPCRGSNTVAYTSHRRGIVWERKRAERKRKNHRPLAPPPHHGAPRSATPPIKFALIATILISPTRRKGRRLPGGGRAPRKAKPFTRENYAEKMAVASPAGIVMDFFFTFQGRRGARKPAG